jgi:FkbM family methyltransferase
MQPSETGDTGQTNGRAGLLSKRQFLVGAVAGACTLQAGKWISAASTNRSAEKKLELYQPWTSYAQAGEDVIVSNIFNCLELPQPSYIDIGAAHPININNTYLFYTKGCRGVLVEPNADLTPVLKEVRPRDTVLTIGIGVSSQKEADFYQITEPSWSTFDKETAEHYERETKGRVRIKEVRKVPLVNINEIFQEHFGGGAPDFVSIDIEGFEVPVLKSLNFEKHRPKVVCVETLVAATTRQKLEAVELLIDKGYVARGATFANTIMVDKRLLG